MILTLKMMTTLCRIQATRRVLLVDHQTRLAHRQAVHPGLVQLSILTLVLANQVQPHQY